jgi:hypothetical protein
LWMLLLSLLKKGQELKETIKMQLQTRNPTIPNKITRQN